MTQHDPDDTFRSAREAFAAWRERVPSDLVAADTHLALLNADALPSERAAALHERATAFGRVVRDDVGPLVEHYRRALPEHVPYDGHGNRVDEIRFDDAYHRAGAHVWGSGLLALAAEGGRSHEMATLFYLASHEGEMGHMCAVTCTSGMIRVLRRHATADVQDRYLPGLGACDYREALRGAQFLTEVQGGSDVGANASVARHDGDAWSITGEKWFCSVVDAGAFLLLARPAGATDGTRGLGCYVMPRHVDGRPNGFRVRRLKDKLGTTAMASGEIDFDGARAELVGSPDDGFKIMVTAMLNTSRWLNALGDVGILRRAYLEAAGYAATRRAFGQRIGDLPLVRRQLAEIKAEWLAALHSTWHLTALDEAVDVAALGGPAVDAEVVADHRFSVNANKLACSLATTDAVRRAIEVLGGNGAIEDFSVLPRLLRDAVVYEQWEGTHNVLAAQVLRDLGRLGTRATVFGRIASMLKGVASAESEPIASQALAALDELADDVEACLADPMIGALHFRSALESTMRAQQVALLLRAAESPNAGALAAELRAAARLLANRHLEHGYRPERDGSLPETIDALLAADLT
jgi:acyl-CoA dehydrogenase